MPSRPPPRQTVLTDGPFAAVASAKDVYSSCVRGLGEEVACRQKVVAELKSHLARMVRAKVWGERGGGCMPAEGGCGAQVTPGAHGEGESVGLVFLMVVWVSRRELWMWWEGGKELRSER